MKYAVIGDELVREIADALTQAGHVVTAVPLGASITAHASQADVVVLDGTSASADLAAAFVAMEASGLLGRVVPVVPLTGGFLSPEHLGQTANVVTCSVEIRETPLSDAARRQLVRAILRAGASQRLGARQVERLKKYRNQARETFAAGDLTELERRDVSVEGDITVHVLASLVPGSSRLTVLFSGAIDPKRAAGKPVFQRSSWRDGIEGSVVYIADPTLSLHPALRIGWGQGGKGRTLISALVGVVEGVVDACHDRGDRRPDVVAYGSSAGGFLALQLASYAGMEVRCLANNPQLDWLRYEVRSAVAETIQYCYPGEPQHDFRKRHHESVALTEVWRATGYLPSAQLWVNSASSTDMQLQLLPVLTGLESFIGNHSFDALDIHLYADHEAGHNPLSKDATLALINAPLDTWRSARLERNQADAVSDEAIIAPMDALHRTELEENQHDRRGIVFGSEPHRFASLDDFLARDSSPNGNYEVDHGLPIHLHWTDRGADVTFVAFTGSVTSQVVNVPAFSGYGTTRHLDANVLLISDPSIIIDRRLHLAWNAGSLHQPQLQDDFTSIIRTFAGNTRLVLFGPSGGGFAALEQATRFPGSTVIASNPQTDVRQYSRSAVEDYFRLGWGMSVPAAANEFPFRVEVCSAYSKPVDANIVYIQNHGDPQNVARHWEPFVDDLHVENRLLTLMPNLGWGNVGPGSDSLGAIFSAVIDEEDWSKLVSRLRSMEIRSTAQEADQRKQSQPREKVQRLFVYGSCVSRDMTAHAVTKYECVQYVARQSWISAATSAVRLPNIPTRLTSPFQIRCVNGDYGSNAHQILREHAGTFDVLLMDLIDERSGVFPAGEGYLTNTWELGMSGWLGESVTAPCLELDTDEHFELWKSAAVKLLEVIHEVGAAERAFVIDTRYSLHSAQGDDLAKQGKPLPPAEWNRRFQRYYDALPELGFNVITMPQELMIANRDHVWGLEPYHYIDAYYERLDEEIRARIGLPTGHATA